MGIKLESITDEKLKRRILDAIGNAESLVTDIRSECQCDQTVSKKKRIRQSSKPEMNALEREFHLRLIPSKNDCDITVQSMRFKLGNGVWYKPDFVVFPKRLEDFRPVAYEVKGPHAFRGGLENLKVAAHAYPMIEWALVWKEGGVWMEQIVMP